MNFHHHMSDLMLVQTFHREFSGSSRAQNLNPHMKLWYWTKGNWKRLTGSRAQTKNYKFFNQKKQPQSWPNWPRHHTIILLRNGIVIENTVSTSHVLQKNNYSVHRPRSHTTSTMKNHHMWVLHVAPPKFLTLRAAQGPWWILGSETLRKLISWAKSALHWISTKSWFLAKFLNFHHHVKPEVRSNFFTTNFLEALRFRI